MKRITTLIFLLLSVIADAGELPKNEFYFGTQFLFSPTHNGRLSVPMFYDNYTEFFFPRLSYALVERKDFHRFNIGYQRQIQLKYFEVVIGGNLQYTNAVSRGTYSESMYTGKDYDIATGKWTFYSITKVIDYTRTYNYLELQSIFGFAKTIELKKILIRPELIYKAWKFGYSTTEYIENDMIFPFNENGIGGYSFISYDFGITFGVRLRKNFFLTLRGSLSSECYPQYFKYPKPEVYGLRLGFSF